MGKSRVVAGAFDAEIYWRYEDEAVLPAYKNREADHVVLAMDELLFLICTSQDILVTRFAMSDEQICYLKRIGFEFQCNRRDVTGDKGNLYDKSKDIFELLCVTEYADYFHDHILPGRELCCYAGTPYTGEFVEKYLLSKHNFIQENVIRKVNGKLYSTELNGRLFWKKHARIVHSAGKLRETCLEFLERGPVLIKENFGVSGRGNLCIDSACRLEYIANYISRQERNGKKVSFIVEQLLDKDTDFSCQFYVNEAGAFELCSVQQIRNKNFSYQGSFSAPEDFMEELREKRYFERLQKVSGELYKEGYYGHVCVDSMVLKDQSLEEVVEINARMSMSLLKSYLDRFLAGKDQTGYITYLSMKLPGKLTYAQVLKRLEEENVLYVGGDHGIIPLTPKAMFINTEIESTKEKVYGRLYIGVVGDDCMDSFLRVLESMGIKIE